MPEAGLIGKSQDFLCPVDIPQEALVPCKLSKRVTTDFLPCSQYTLSSPNHWGEGEHWRLGASDKADLI